MILDGDDFDAAYAGAREIEARRGLVFILPVAAPRVIAGHGTIGVELVDEVPDGGAGYRVEEALHRWQAVEAQRKRAAKAAPSPASHSVTEVWP